MLSQCVSDCPSVWGSTHCGRDDKSGGFGKRLSKRSYARAQPKTRSCVCASVLVEGLAALSVTDDGFIRCMYYGYQPLDWWAGMCQWWCVRVIKLIRLIRHLFWCTRLSNSFPFPSLPSVVWNGLCARICRRAGCSHWLPYIFLGWESRSRHPGSVHQ